MVMTKPPSMQTLIEILHPKADCAVSADDKGGHPDKEDKRTKHMDAHEKIKSPKRGTSTMIGRQYNMEQL